MGRKHLIIPDMQLAPGGDTEHLDHIAKYIVDKKPDVLVIIGDWADMPSLSSYDEGKKSFEGRTYLADTLAANDGLQRLMAPIEAEMERIQRRKIKRWNLRKIVTLGNHEDRISRAIENDRKLEGLISLDDIFFKQWGFEVYPFLQPVIVDGVAYCHYFVSGIMGRPVTTSRALVSKHHMSCIAGHLPGFDIATAYRGDGTPIIGIICGSGYPQDLSYLNHQTNRHFRGIVVAHDVEDGAFDHMNVSLKFLKQRYG